MINWTKTLLNYYAEYVKLTNYKFADYFMSLSDEEFEEEMVAVILKLMIYNKKVVLFETFTKQKIDVIDFNEIDKNPTGISWIPPNFAKVEDYLSFVDSLWLNEETGDIKIVK